jgi:predicted nucleotidyltransferase
MPLTQWQVRQKPRLDAELARIVERLRTLDPERVILFGSFARGDFHENSDIDLVVVVNTEERFIDRIGRVLEVLDVRDFDISPLVYTPAEIEQMRARGNGFLAEVERDGKVLYERNAGQQPR